MTADARMPRRTPPAARLLLALGLALLAADRAAVVARRGDRPLWRLDGAGEMATIRAGQAGLAALPACGRGFNAGSASPAVRESELCPRLAPGLAGLVALGVALFGPGAAALVAARVVTLLALAGAALAFLRTAERVVWGGRADLTLLLGVVLGVALRDVAVNVSGHGLAAAGMLAGAAWGLAPRRAWMGLVLGGLGSLATASGLGVATMSMAAAYMAAGRTRAGAARAALLALGALTATLIRFGQAAWHFGIGEALRDRLSWPVVPAETLGAAAWIAAVLLAGRLAAAQDGSSAVRASFQGPASTGWIAAAAALASAAFFLAVEIDPMRRGWRALVLAAGLALLAAAAVLLSRLSPATAAGDRGRNLALGGTCVAAGVFVLEIAFAHVPRSHGVGYTLAARLWAPNLLPINAAQYRDGEYTPARAAKPYKILVVGDSLAQGGGIADVNDRFANVLAAHLPGDHEVFVLAQGGVDTRHEYEFLTRFPWAPRAVILSYYPNDIEGRAAERAPAPRFTPYLDVPEAARGLVRRSYLLNFVYWLFPHGDTDAYRRFVQDAYADPDVMASHLGDLDRIAEFATVRGVPLVAVLFPFLDDLDGSQRLLAPVARRLQERGATVLDATELIRPLPPRRRVVNPQDAHPGVDVHRRVGDALAERLRGLGVW